MSKMRMLVTICVCAIVAIGGTAIAGSGPEAWQSASAKKTAKKALKKAKKALKATKGIEDGQDGQDGADGADGANGYGLTSASTTVPSLSTRYMSLEGTGTSGASASPFEALGPNVATTLSDLNLVVPEIEGIESLTFEISVNGSIEATCTVNTGGQSCDTTTVALPANALVGVTINTSALAGSRVVLWNWTFSPA